MEQQLIGKSKAIETVKRHIASLAKTTTDVLLIGEVGVGKGTAANNIHSTQYSSNGHGEHPYVTVNAGIIDDKELETILLGFERGVPGMPPTTKRGLFELGDNGTVVIEEAEEASFRNQKIILNYLETRSTIRLGGTQPSPSNTRVILTMKETPRNLREAGKLLEEFANKLEDVEQLAIPPLRDRPEDIPMLVKYFVSEIGKEVGLKDITLDINAIDVLVRHAWRENIRELKAVIDKSVLFSTGGKFVLPPELVDEKTEVVKMINNVVAGQEFILDRSLDLIEKGIIERALHRFAFNQSRTAGFLGMTEQTLRYKLKRLGIPSARQR
ncbi:MAG: sigma 54-interacting transcriptional regulator [Ignavibacteriae bacterium]|nr:sigma 54-interacting transcriptional regulator [Ignavibacteriota bacterium]